MTHPSGGSAPTVIVIGGGHNGLTCAAYLARAGLRVTVLERRDILGGACVTEELMPGYRCSTASLVTSLFRPEIAADLDLAAHGLEFIPRNPSVVALFPDGRHLSLGSDERACVAEVAKFSKADADAYPAYGRTMRRLADHIEPLLMNPLPGLARPLDPGARNGHAPGRYGSADAAAVLRDALRRAAELPGDDLPMLMELLTGSAAGFLDRWFESDAIKVPLVIDGITGVDASPSMPGSAYLMLYHMTGVTEVGRPAWGQVRGGMGGITAALASAARSHSAVIRTDAPVARIVTRDGRATGVVLASGEELSADAVVSAADPYTTFVRLMEADALPGRYRRSMENRRFQGVAMKMHLALDRLPEVRGFPPGLGPQHNATMLIAPTMEYLEEAYADARAGRPSANPHIEATVPSVLDPTVAPEGRHLMGLYIQYAPYRLAGASWDDIRDSYADRVLECMEEYLPGITDSVVDRCVLTPLDLERRLGLTGGDLYHGAMTADQLFFLRGGTGPSSHHTPVDGLYLCGSGAHPGGGVFGVPGRNGAHVVMSDLDRS
ncbi:phytoene desaturase family protein [Micromonospora sp. NPDC048830]|uniref:phytoene desaturase family protein n=1 Tax=Micromonospora sp. NPDC048830 TaxID=3364257 RepID=UPI00371DCBDF